MLPYIIRVAGHNTGWRLDNTGDYILAELEAFFIVALPRRQTIYLQSPDRFISAALREMRNEAGFGPRWKIRQWREGEL